MENFMAQFGDEGSRAFTQLSGGPINDAEASLSLKSD